MNFVTFSVPQGPAAKMSQKWPPGASPGPSGGLPGTPWRPEIDQLFALGGPQGANNDFLGTPGPPQSPSRRAPGSLWKQGRRPRVAQRPPGSHFGAISAPFSTLRGIIFRVLRSPFAFDFRVQQKSAHTSDTHHACMQRNAWAREGGRRCWRSHSQ